MLEVKLVSAYDDSEFEAKVAELIARGFRLRGELNTVCFNTNQKFGMTSNTILMVRGCYEEDTATTQQRARRVIDLNDGDNDALRE